MKIYGTVLILIWFGMCHDTTAAPSGPGNLSVVAAEALPKLTGQISETGASGSVELTDQRETRTSDFSRISLADDEGSNSNIVAQESIKATGSTGQFAPKDPREGTYGKSLDVDDHAVHSDLHSQGVTTLAHIVPGNGKYVYGVALLRDDLFVTRYGESQISVYDAITMKIKRRISIPGYRDWDEGLAVCPYNKYLYVSDTDGNNQLIHRIALSSNYNITTWKLPVRYSKLQLSVNSERNLLVTYSDSVQEYTPSGMFVRELRQQTGLRHAIEGIDDTLIVSRIDPIHGVEHLTWDGEIINSYGNQAGSGQGQMYNPQNMALYSETYVLVTEFTSKGRVHVLNPSLTIGRTIQLPSVTLSSLWGISYNESRGRLYVGEYHSPSRLLVFDNVTIASMFA